MTGQPLDTDGPPIVVRGLFNGFDGRMIHDMYLAQVKKPDESKYQWDYYNIRQTIPADEAFLPLAQSKCPLVKK